MVNRNNILHWITILIILLPLISCSEWNPFSDNKEEVKVFNNVKSYQRIELRGIYTVKLKQSEEPKIIFSGTKSQLNKTTIKTDEEWLKIKSPGDKQWRSQYKKPELTILVDSLRELWSYCPINLISEDTLKSNRLKIYLIGELSECNLIVHSDYFRFVNSSTSTGKYKVKGKAEEFYCRLRGSSHIEARGLKADHVGFNHESIGDGYIYAEEGLHLTSKSSGNLYYKGSPEKIKTEFNSSGKLIPLD
jgi:hypothetical protein